MRNGMTPVHPGEILREEMETLNLSANQLSKALCVPVNRVTLILNLNFTSQSSVRQRVNCSFF